MNTRMITLAATIAVIMLLAVGVGFAYSAYTSNTTNTITAEYLIMVPSDGTDTVYSDSFENDINLDTQTVTGDKVNYSISDPETIGGHKYGKAGEIILTIDETKSTADYTLSVIVEGGTGLNLTDYAYYAQFGDSALVALSTVGGNQVATSSTIDNDPENDETEITVKIYVGMKGGDTLQKDVGSYVGTTVLDNVTFLFKASTV